MPKLLLDHDWNVSPKEAITIQQQLCKRVITTDRLNNINSVAGIDVGFEGNGSITKAAVAVLHYPSLKLQESSFARRPTSYPYVPGLLSFRELPSVLKALAKLNRLPDILLCDGHGYAHPRRFGLACHLGVITDIPAIGVGKTRLIGVHKAVPDKRGAWQPLVDKDELVGAVLRSRQGVKPIFISIGHRISLETAIKIVMKCITRYKLPETTRMAHKFASNN